MRLTIARDMFFTASVVVIGAARVSGDQISVGLDPIAPAAPTSMAECDALGQQWSARRVELGRELRTCNARVEVSCRSASGGDFIAEGRCLAKEQNPATRIPSHGLYKPCEMLFLAERATQDQSGPAVQACRARVTQHEMSRGAPQQPSVQSPGPTPGCGPSRPWNCRSTLGRTQSGRESLNATSSNSPTPAESGSAPSKWLSRFYRDLYERHTRYQEMLASADAANASPSARRSAPPPTFDFVFTPARPSLASEVVDAFKNSTGTPLASALDDILSPPPRPNAEKAEHCLATAHVVTSHFSPVESQLRYTVRVRHNVSSTCNIRFDVTTGTDAKYQSQQAAVALAVPSGSVDYTGALAAALTEKGRRVAFFCANHGRVREHLLQERDEILKRYNVLTPELNRSVRYRDELQESTTLARIAQIVQGVRLTVAVAQKVVADLIDRARLLSKAGCAAAAVFEAEVSGLAACLPDNNEDPEHCADQSMQTLVDALEGAAACFVAPAFSELAQAQELAERVSSIADLESGRRHTLEVIDLVERSIRRYRNSLDQLTADQTLIDRALLTIETSCRGQMAPALMVDNVTCSCFNRLP